METKEKLKAKIAIPLDSFSPLIQENCGEELNENNCIDLVIRNMFSLYSHFSNTTSLGFIYASKGLFKDEPMDMLDSPVSLRPFRKHLSNGSNAIKFIYSVDYDYYTVLRSTVFHGYEIMNFQEKGVSDSAILNIMSKNALALDYWVLFHINDGKRIGVIGYKNGKPNPQGFFKELDLQKIICNYDAKKSFSIEEEDFLVSASKDEIGDTLADLIGDFKKELSINGKTSLLYRLKQKIEYYGTFVQWDSVAFFKEKLGIESK